MLSKWKNFITLPCSYLVKKVAEGGGSLWKVSLYLCGILDPGPSTAVSTAGAGPGAGAGDSSS